MFLTDAYDGILLVVIGGLSVSVCPVSLACGVGSFVGILTDGHRQVGRDGCDFLTSSPKSSFPPVGQEGLLIDFNRIRPAPPLPPLCVCV